MLHYKLALKTLRKGSNKVFVYLLKIKKLVDCLNYSGFLVSEDDHITHILAGLGPDYNPLAVTVTA